MQLEEIIQRDPASSAPSFPPLRHLARLECPISARTLALIQSPDLSDVTRFACTCLPMCMFCPMQFHHMCRFVDSPPQSSDVTAGIYVFKEVPNSPTLLASLPEFSTCAPCSSCLCLTSRSRSRLCIL